MGLRYDMGVEPNGYVPSFSWWEWWHLAIGFWHFNRAIVDGNHTITSCPCYLQPLTKFWSYLSFLNHFLNKSWNRKLPIEFLLKEKTYILTFFPFCGHYAFVLNWSFSLWYILQMISLLFFYRCCRSVSVQLSYSRLLRPTQTNFDYIFD